jgi:hypothetical protein
MNRLVWPLLGAISMVCLAVLAPGAVAQSTSAASLANSANDVFNVVAYGAVGDCKGGGSTASCKDNTAAIQQAIDAAYAVGGAVYFPTNPSRKGQTVYYVANSIDFKGVSMWGHPGGSGPSNDFPQFLPVAVRGAPGKDVFHSLDPTNPSYVVPLQAPDVHDLAIIVDNTVDASSSGSNSFPNRLPGRTCWDASIAASSAVLTSSAQCEFQPGDVGQNILVYGAGSGGGNLSTTIASWQSAKQVTLSESASNPVSGAHAYISVMGLSAMQTLGNCGFAYDDKDGKRSTSNGNVAKGRFADVVIQTTGGSANNTCGYFFQANSAPYFVRWEHGFVGGTFGWVFAPASNAPPSPNIWAGMADFNTFDQMFVNSMFPFVAYDGGYDTFRDTQIYSGSGYGPQILEAYGLETYSWYWYIDIPEIESTPKCPTPPGVGLRLSGRLQTVRRFSLINCSTLQWDASDSVAYTFITSNRGSSSTINIAGNNNVIESPFYPNGPPTNFNITGTGDQWISGENSNPYKGIEPARKQYAGNTLTPPNLPQLSRGAIVFNRTHDFLDTGASNYYFNGEDLWFWPRELLAAPGVSFATGTDSQAQTGNYILNPSGGAVYLGGSNGSTWAIGNGQFPAGKMRFYFRARTENSTTNWFADVQAQESGAWKSLGCNARFSGVNSTYSVYSCDADATGLTGDPLRVVLGGYGLPSANIFVDWVGVRPWDTDTVSQSLTLGAGNAPVTSSDSLMRYCGAARFSSSTTSGPISCPWVTASSHCDATWVGANLSGGSLGYTVSNGSIKLSAAVSNSGTASVACNVK